VSREGNHQNEVWHEVRAAVAASCSSASLVAWLPLQGVLRNVRRTFPGPVHRCGPALIRLTVSRCAAPRARWMPGGVTCPTAAPPARSYWAAGASLCADRGRLRRHGELALPSFKWAAGCDPLDAATLDTDLLLTRRTTARKESSPLKKRTRMSTTSLKQPFN
jgi:hypothetical protein